MREYLPLIIVGAIVGIFSIVFLVVYLLEKNKKEKMGFDRHMKDGEIVKRLLKYAKPYTGQFVLVVLIMLFSIVYDITSPLLIGHIEDTVTDSGKSGLCGYGILRKLFEASSLYYG